VVIVPTKKIFIIIQYKGGFRMKLKIYNGGKNYMFPNMSVATPERVRAEYSAVNNFTCVITTDDYDEVIYAIEPFGAMKSKYNIDPNLSDAEALVAIETIINTPPTVSTDPTPEERIAAALEFQNVLALPDATV
jgi:hypothetical protein